MEDQGQRVIVVRGHENDVEHLRLLSIFYYVLGGLAAAFACFPIIHLIMGIVMVVVAVSGSGGGDAPPLLVGLFFMMVPLVLMSIGWAYAVCMFITAHHLSRRTKYWFCFVIAAITCLFPLGTVLGVFTIIVLVRPSVKARFGVLARDNS